jgi:hypothetical protein
MRVNPKEFVLGFDSLWNTGNRDAILAAVDDDSVVELSPAPPPPGAARYAGRAEVTRFVDTFLPGFHVESRNFRTEGEEIVWESDVRNDVFRAMGADLASGTTRAALSATGTLRRFSFTLDERTLEMMKASATPPV